MDSPRGRVYQMVQVSEGKASINPSYIEHIDLCLACRACETACPSGVQYGRLVEAARAHIEQNIERPWHIRLLRGVIFNSVLPSRLALKAAGTALYAYQATGLQKLVRTSGLLKLMGKMGRVEELAPSAEMPQFYRYYGRTLPAIGPKQYKVAFLGGCMANVFFARLNEATVRVLQRNGCEVSIPDKQTCCGALHVHAGLREPARELAKQNIERYGGRGLRRHHHECGGLRFYAQGVSRAVRTRPEVSRQGSAVHIAGEGCDRVPGGH